MKTGRLSFYIENNKYEILGSIVRTGLIRNNPSELAQRYASEDLKEDAYIAVQFDRPMDAVPV